MITLTHVLQIELAQRQAKAIQDMPAECKPEEQGMWVLLKSAFSVNVDKCAKYHEQMMVDPIWEVAPTRVSGSCIIEGVLYKYIHLIDLCNTNTSWHLSVIQIHLGTSL